MQYTLRNIPSKLDKALRDRARREGKSLNRLAVETLATAMGLAAEPAKVRDLSSITGSWVDDPATAAALKDQDRIDPEAWPR